MTSRGGGVVPFTRVSVGYLAAAVVGPAVGGLVFAPHTPTQFKSPAVGGLVAVNEILTSYLAPICDKSTCMAPVYKHSK